MSYKNLARKGPRRVWEDGYRNLRVPSAIFDDVKQFLEYKKQEYLASLEGIVLDRSHQEFTPDDATLSMSSEVQTRIPSMLQQIIREEFAKFQESTAYVNLASQLPQRKKTAKERVKELLVKNQGSLMTTIQIGEMLDLPAPTCRQATRELADEDETISQIAGRPNKFRYDPS
ncbi:MAG: hypothetical protein ACW98K_00420 [Candidatus Kariarchaeaceae archaeon]